MIKRLTYIVPALLFLLLSGVLLWSLTRQAPDELPSSFINQSAPTVEGLGKFGKVPEFNKVQLIAPEIKIVNFWASWCVPCRVEHPNIEQLAAQGIPIYGINYKDDFAQGNAFLQELGNPYHAIGADNGRIAIEWGVYGIPETFVIDAYGRVVLRHAGPVTAQILQDDILPLIGALQAQ